MPQSQYKSHFGGIYKVAVHPRRPKVFASCSVDNTVKVWNADRNNPMRTLDEHFGYGSLLDGSFHINTFIMHWQIRP